MKNIQLSRSTRPLLWCDECHCFHDKSKDCPYTPDEQNGRKKLFNLGY